MSEPQARSRRPYAALVALVFGLAVVAGLAAVYVARRQIAREAVSGWLASKGVASETQFAVIAPGRLVGRIRIGPAAAPDLTVDRAEVRYSLAALLSGRGLEVTEVRLTRPVLRARWRGGRFSAGELDPLIREFLAQPPKPGEPHPRILVDGGRLSLASDYGVLDARVQARIEDARLIDLDAVAAPRRWTLGGATADVGAASLTAHTRGGRLQARFTAPFSEFAAPAGTLRRGMLTVALEGAYPELAGRAPLAARVATTLTAESATGRGAVSGPVAISLPDLRLAWRREDGVLAGDGLVEAHIESVAAGDLRLAAASASGPAGFALGAAPQVRWQGRGEISGGWNGLGAPAAGDPAQVAAVKRGVRAFRLTAEGLSAVAGPGRVDLRLTGPLSLRPAAGGELRVTPAGRGYRIVSGGGGLPEVRADLRRVAIEPAGALAEGDVQAAFSVAGVQQARVNASGLLRVAGGQASFAASRCARVEAARVAAGENDVTQVSADLCPLAAPLLRVGPRGWALSGRAQAVRALVPFLQARVDDGAAVLNLDAVGPRLSGRVALEAAGVTDTSASTRFRPFVLGGRAELAGDLVTGAFDARFGKGGTVARAIVRQDLRRGEGSVQLATGRLAFAPGVLQPADLSPRAEPLGTAVTGTAAFDGVVRWGPDAGGGEGRLVLDDLGFRSAAGQVSGLTGDIRFTSLTPLIAPPGQTVRIREIAAAVPLTDVSGTLELKEKSLVLTAGEASVGGGRLRLERLEASLEPGQSLAGAFAVEGVQLHDLVEASPFGDRVDLDARVSGRIPFRAQGGKVTIAGGDLHAIVPGRLSISRAALTSVSAQGSIQAPSPAAPMATTDTFTDFAYQALENLAFDKLDAGVNTRTDGRLGVQFHIVGRHDPPKPQEITISWLDLIRRKFLGRKLPLPSGTGVDLTLDTTLNLDDLLKDYADFERLRSSPQVQR